MTHKYIGTKIINATPMNRADYNTFRGWTLPSDENGADEGYLVEYTDGGKANTPHYAGYVSWSPKEQFEAAYLPVGNVSGLPAHQQRVVAEKAALDDKFEKLEKFIEGSSVFNGLSREEQDNLIAQHDAMGQYSTILGIRIASFASESKLSCEAVTTDASDKAKGQANTATSNQAIEQEIQAKGLTAPRVTPADIEANIASEFYFTATEGVLGASEMGTKPAGRARALDLLTFCVLVLRNGFTVTGESACASPENFAAELGRKIARENAINKVWPLIGYQLKERLYQATLPAQAPE